MDLGNKITNGLVIVGGTMVVLGVIGKIVVFLISICGGFNG